MNIKLKAFLNSKWMVIIAFVALVGPFALDYNLYYPDEQYYTDGAIKMVETNDYFTPKLGSNEQRFKKPILTYWVVLAGHQLFGVSAFSSRVLFLFAGVLVILLVYRIGLLVSDDKKVALLSAIIIASNPTLMLSATRSIPDILLCLFMALAFWGFSGLMKYGNDAPKKYLWMIYLGIALAFESKGLPALALGGIALLFQLLNPWQRIQLKTLLHFPSLLSGIGIAVSWFVAMYFIHGSVYLESFFNDQVGNRVASQLTHYAVNLGMAIGFLFLLFLPWIFHVFKTNKSNTNVAGSVSLFNWFTLISVISIVIMSVFVSRFYERYLLPVFPLVAVSIALLIQKRIVANSTKILRVFAIVLIVGVIVLYGLALFLNVGIGTTWFGWLLVSFVPLFLWGAIAAIRNNGNLVLWNAVLIMMIIYSASLSMRPISFPGEYDQIIEYLNEKGIAKSSSIAFVGNLQVAAKVRVAFGYNYPMTTVSDTNVYRVLNDYDYLLLEDRYRYVLPAHKQIDVAALNWDPVLVDEIVKGIISRDYIQRLTLNGKYYYLAKIED